MRRCHVLVILGLLITSTLVGCAAPRNYHIVSPFNESEFEPYSGNGSSTIQGQAFLKTRGGEVRFGAGNEVNLIPSTSYSKEIWEASKNGAVFENMDTRYLKYIRKTIADGSGNFEFKNIPAGEYFLECPIFWQIPAGYGAMQSTGAWVKRETKVEPNQTLKVILTQ